MSGKKNCRLAAMVSATGSMATACGSCLFMLVLCFVFLLKSGVDEVKKEQQPSLHNSSSSSYMRGTDNPTFSSLRNTTNTSKIDSEILPSSNFQVFPQKDKRSQLLQRYLQYHRRTRSTISLTSSNLDFAVDLYLQSPSAAIRLFGGPISTWDTSRVTSLQNIFSTKRNPKMSDFNEDLSEWDVRKVTSMTQTFYGASSFNSPLWQWNVARVTRMDRMFRSAFKFNQPLTFWNTSQVESTFEMFRSATRFNQPLTFWDVQKVSIMSGMFRHAASYNQRMLFWKVDKVKSMSHMFHGATKLDQYLFQWNVEKVTSMKYMFAHASSFRGQQLSKWEVSNVHTMHHMFFGAVKFQGKIGTWRVDQVTDMSSMFYQAYSFAQPLWAWQVERVTSMKNMFRSAKNFDRALYSWNVSKVTSMGGMFRGASKFDRRLEQWDVSKVVDCQAMFYKASRFQGDLCPWGEKLPKSAKVFGMFQQSACPRQENPMLKLPIVEPLCHACVPSSAPSMAPSLPPTNECLETRRITDHFDNGLTLSSLWYEKTTTGIPSGRCGGLEGSKSLFFNHVTARIAETVDLVTVCGGVVQFALLIASSQSSARSRFCNGANPGEDVFLEYSLDQGDSWVFMKVFKTYQVPRFTMFQLDIPTEAQTRRTRFRWVQKVFTKVPGFFFDNWAIDDVLIDGYIAEEEDV